jgi:nitroreductase
MTVLDAVRSKRAVREFADRPLAEADLDHILDAGRRAHSAKNLQRWAFVVVRDRARLQELSTVGPWAGHLAGAAAAVALITPDPRAPGASLSVTWDLGGAAAQMMLVAWDLGVGSCPATVYEHERARRILGYPADMHCEFVLSFGYPNDPAVLTRPNRPGGRRSAGEIVHQERWSASDATEDGRA